MSLPSGLARLYHDEDGQDLLEYVLLATFISLMFVAVAGVFGSAVSGWYQAVTGNVNTAAGSANPGG